MLDSVHTTVCRHDALQEYHRTRDIVSSLKHNGTIRCRLGDKHGKGASKQRWDGFGRLTIVVRDKALHTHSCAKNQLYCLRGERRYVNKRRLSVT